MYFIFECKSRKIFCSIFSSVSFVLKMCFRVISFWLLTLCYQQGMPLNDLFMDTRKWQFDTGWEKLIKKEEVSEEESEHLSCNPHHPKLSLCIHTYSHTHERSGRKKILRADHIDIDYLILWKRTSSTFLCMDIYLRI